jgi:dihydroorotase
VKTILKNGRILDPSQEIDIVGNLVIEDGQITELGPETSEDGADEVYECRGLWIAPGLVDLDCRLREPGQNQRETIRTGTMAAAAGGYTTICTMPDTSPALDSPAFVDFILDKAASPDAGGVFVAPVGALTIGQQGERLASYSGLKKAGVVAVSDEGGPIQTAGLMLRAMEHCLQIDLPIMVHCEDTSLSGQGAMNDGAVSAMLGLKGIPRSAEEVMVHRNCVLALNTGCRIHILRVSTWGSVETIRQFKYLGAPITCEVLPQHFCLTEDSVGEFDPHFKASPPLRTAVDVDLVQQALADGAIDCIASGHAPFAPYEVDVPFDEAPAGFSGLESALGVTLTHLTQKGVLSPLETIRRMSTTPAEILRLEAGSLKPGSSPLAQVILIDPNAEWAFDVNRTFSRGKNSPFHRMDLQGKAVLTFVGTEIYRDPLFEDERYFRLS